MGKVFRESPSDGREEQRGEGEKKSLYDCLWEQEEEERDGGKMFLLKRR